jgi:hypothetical protein
MDMRQALLMAGGLVALASATSMVPAFAQGYAKDRPMVHTEHLQPVEWPHSRPQLSIEDETPLLNDHRRPIHRTRYVVKVGPVQGDSTQTVVVEPSGLSNNPMMGDRILDDAGPRSYVHQQPITQGRDLPQGTRTGGYIPAPRAVAPHAGPGNFTASKQSVNGSLTIPHTDMYQGPTGSIGGATASHIKTSTTVKMLSKMR